MFQLISECEQTFQTSYNIRENFTRAFTESATIKLVSESASSVLNDVLKNIENKQDPLAASENGDKTLNIVTALFLLAQPGTTDGFNLQPTKVSKLINLAGESPDIDKNLDFIASHGNSLKQQLTSEFTKVPQMSDQQREMIKRKILTLKAECDKLTVMHSEWKTPASTHIPPPPSPSPQSASM